MKIPVIVIGAGGHARVLIDALQKQRSSVIGAVEADPKKQGVSIFGVPVLGDDAVLDSYGCRDVLLANGIGSTDVPAVRKEVFERFRAKGFTFATIIHPSAFVAGHVMLSEGVQIMAGAVVQPGCAIGRNSIINTGSIIDHDCSIGEHVHVAPGTTLSGGVAVGDGTHIGTGTTVIQGITIGDRCIVGAGSVVVKNVPPGAKVRGVPAREIL